MARHRRGRRRGGGFPLLTRAGIAWFTAEGYDALLGVMVEPHDMPWSLEAWRDRAESHERGLKRRGIDAVRVVVDPVIFIGWCEARGKLPNGHALARYVFERTFGEDYLRRHNF